MTESWHAECHRLRAEGLSQPEIALRVNKSSSTIRWVLNETDKQREKYKRIRERRRKRPEVSRKREGKLPYRAARAAAPGTITPEIKREAILAFSRHEIDRFEMMCRITPQNKWQGCNWFKVEWERTRVE